MKNLIGISGKAGSGKSTVAKIIQELILGHSNEEIEQSILNEAGSKIQREDSGWEVKKFADKLKDIVCILIGCTKEDLESQEFKSRELKEDWIKYKLHDGSVYRNISKEKYDLLPKEIKDSKTLIEKLKVRDLLQLVGTDCIREKVHNNAWVNSLFADYTKDCKWIADDVRFDNEYQAVKFRNGLIIRVERPTELRFPKLYTGYTNQEEIETWEDYLKSIDLFSTIYHESEISLDNHEFDYVIDNNGDTENLIQQVKEILIKEKIIK